MERWLFAAFLLLAAAQDLKEKQVDIWIYLLFGGAALALGTGRELADGAACSWLEYLSGVVPGIGLLAVSALSRGEIGAGDGYFFLVSGLFLEFWDNLMMLCYGVLFCGFYCLGYWFWCRFHMDMDAGKRIVPFLPFVVPPGIWLVMRGGF